MGVVSPRGLPLIALLLLALAGCGEDGLDRAELADRADAICVEYDKQARALGELDLADEQRAATYFEQAADLAGRQQSELERLEPAEDAQAAFDRFVEASAKARAALADAAEATPTRAELLADIEPLAAEIDAAADELGAARCGESD